MNNSHRDLDVMPGWFNTRVRPHATSIETCADHVPTTSDITNLILSVPSIGFTALFYRHYSSNNHDTFLQNILPSTIIHCMSQLYCPSTSDRCNLNPCQQYPSPASTFRPPGNKNCVLFTFCTQFVFTFIATLAQNGISLPILNKHYTAFCQSVVGC